MLVVSKGVVMSLFISLGAGPVNMASIQHAALFGLSPFRKSGVLQAVDCVLLVSGFKPADISYQYVIYLLSF